MKKDKIYFFRVILIVTFFAVCLGVTSCSQLNQQLKISSEINITQEGIDINSGDEFSFGNILVNSNKEITFTIENNGTDDLIIKGIKIVSEIENLFTVTMPENLVIPLGCRETFIVSLTPNFKGAITASIEIESNDLDEEKYSFTMSGQSVSGITYPEQGLYGENLLSYTSQTVIIKKNYSLAVNVMEGAKVKIEMPYNQIETSNNWWFSGSVGYWVQTPESGNGKRVWLCQVAGVSDILVSFSGSWNTSIYIYENDETTPKIIELNW